jgi:hypothetical protein
MVAELFLIRMVTKIVEDGDYALVHFYLKADHELSPNGVYVFGEFTDWQMKEKFTN